MYVNFIGRLGADPEKRVTPNGKTLFSLSVAYNDKQTKETVWVKVTLSSIYENLMPYLTKGKQLFVSGKMKAPKVSEKGKVFIDVFANAVDLINTEPKEQQEQQQNTSQAPHRNDFGAAPF